MMEVLADSHAGFYEECLVEDGGVGTGVSVQVQHQTD